MPPAPVWTAWKHANMTALNSDAYHGTSLSMTRPPSGPIATPNMPIKPNKPITNLSKINQSASPTEGEYVF